MIKFTDKRGMETFLSLQRYLDSAVEAASLLLIIQLVIEAYHVEYQVNCMIEDGTDIFVAIEAATLGKVSQEILFSTLILFTKQGTHLKLNNGKSLSRKERD